ncbi:MAG: hypothetical protein GC179_11440 [Anaerolineaceae bacterium]|nr:hypothetical protein [Anaerolineaceae bacterium]
MKWNIRFAAFLLMAVLAGTGCSVLPGLKVLSGQDTGEAAENRLVESSELVMANKSGTTDPALNGVADRIETAAGGSIDIIEIRNDLNIHQFQVYALIIPDPSLDQLGQLNQFRRAIELTWRGIMQQSIGDETLKVALVFPGRVQTLDRGPGFLGVIGATATIDRADALVYLDSGSPSLQNFAGLITDGKLAYDVPPDQELYRGTPNHPVFMLSNLGSSASSGG